MESFIGAILNEWHLFENEYQNTNTLTLFRNIFIVYNSTLNKSFNELKKMYGLESSINNVLLYNDLDKASNNNFIYLHKHNISKKKIKSIIEVITQKNKTCTYEDAISILEKIINANNKVNEQTIVPEAHALISCQLVNNPML